MVIPPLRFLFQDVRRQQSPSVALFSRRGGQSLVESALILLLVICTAVAIMAFPQLLFTHQLPSERSRDALPRGMILRWSNTGDQIANQALCGRPTGGTGAGVLERRRANVRVTSTPGTAANPNDERLTAAIVDSDFRFSTPFFARTQCNHRAAVGSGPCLCSK